MLLPKSIGSTIDAIAKVIEQRKALSVKDGELAEMETILKRHLTQNFAKTAVGIDGARGKFGQAVIAKSTVPEVTDWDKFYAWIAKTKSWDCLQKRPGSTALKLRWDAGKTVPGVEAKEIETLKVSLIKVKK